MDAAVSWRTNAVSLPEITAHANDTFPHTMRHIRALLSLSELRTRSKLNRASPQLVQVLFTTLPLVLFPWFSFQAGDFHDRNSTSQRDGSQFLLRFVGI